jgi:hypothetical protein
VGTTRLQESADGIRRAFDWTTRATGEKLPSLTRNHCPQMSNWNLVALFPPLFPLSCFNCKVRARRRGRVREALTECPKTEWLEWKVQEESKFSNYEGSDAPGLENFHTTPSSITHTHTQEL